MQSPLEYAQGYGFGEIHLYRDPQTGFQAVIALHDLNHGPTFGGCRWIAYRNIEEAMLDAQKLARSMTFKAAISHIPCGGGKATLFSPEYPPKNRAHYLKLFAQWVNTLNGRYITAIDSGTTVDDMDEIAKYTSYVTSTSKEGNPSPWTAEGVLRGIEAALFFKTGDKHLHGKHIAIQGIGQVGYALAKLVHHRGMHITLTDVNHALAEKYAHELNATLVAPDDIYKVRCDIFAPCALGSILNTHTIKQLHCSIIAGSANNQLADRTIGAQLHELGILYTPDYIINAGGLIYAFSHYHQLDAKHIHQKIHEIFDTIIMVFTRAQAQHLPTNIVADALAMENTK